jgi:hypothetical protein
MDQPPTSPRYDTSGPSIRLVLTLLFSLASVLGVLAYRNYVLTERHFREVIAHMDEVGADASVEECVTEVLQWYRSCEGIVELCSHAVPKMMTHCLKAQDRDAYCDGLDLASAKAQWVYEKCADHDGEDQCAGKHKRKCACANAFRAVDSFCRYDQQGVAM